MGQKVNPIGLRIGIIREWDAKWYAPKTKVADLLHEDLKIRKFLNTFYKSAYVSRIETKRTGKRVIVTIHAGKPGLVIGSQGSKKNEAVKQLEKITGKTIFLTVVEVKQAESDKDARIVSRKMAEDLENRASFRRVQKMAIQKALKAGAKGIKTMVSGRLGGAEIARSEWYSEGSVPLHTFRANIDYATAEAATTYGKLGVKVWINKGEKLKRTFDILIFDGTPGLIVTDAMIVSRLVDTTIIVASHNETKKDNLQKVKKGLESVGASVAGVVINKMPVNAKKYEDSYYYGNTPNKMYEEKDIFKKKTRQMNKEEKVLNELNELFNNRKEQ